MSTVIREDPPKKEPKHSEVILAACREPRTFFRFPEPFRSYGSATYLKKKFGQVDGFQLQFKSTRVNDNVWIYVAAFPVGG